MSTLGKVAHFNCQQQIICLDTLKEVLIWMGVTVRNNVNVNGEFVMESTLRITAIEASVMTCSSTSRSPASIGFSISGVL